MPTPIQSNQPGPLSRSSAEKAKSTATANREWRCTRCQKLLGVRQDTGMHLRFARAHEYFVGFPVVATCRGCGTLNQAASTAR
ncbi:MAG: hypothetical protein ACK4HG_00065 [Agrobacterium albertimagni]